MLACNKRRRKDRGGWMGTTTNREEVIGRTSGEQKTHSAVYMTWDRWIFFIFCSHCVQNCLDRLTTTVIKCYSDRRFHVNFSFSIITYYIRTRLNAPILTIKENLPVPRERKTNPPFQAQRRFRWRYAHDAAKFRVYYYYYYYCV